MKNRDQCVDEPGKSLPDPIDEPEGSEPMDTGVTDTEDSEPGPDPVTMDEPKPVPRGPRNDSYGHHSGYGDQSSNGYGQYLVNSYDHHPGHDHQYSYDHHPSYSHQSGYDYYSSYDDFARYSPRRRRRSSPSYSPYRKGSM
ncbi:hypothetical protein BCR34DRAFT_120107 [Clohesyomyces aquaticus]|uniref:Uncharacterized protein n=1 Tax=Clohesyomyces aquaticus TaxID=1231657 RepID=A0A1Y2A172_9PLEO|nr:hypothetical protein BCR34DRAFT_120107 [Clohesyomyces aquaticus]